jgi:hypothetical protein
MRKSLVTFAAVVAFAAASCGSAAESDSLDGSTPSEIESTVVTPDGGDAPDAPEAPEAPEGAEVPPT